MTINGTKVKLFSDSLLMLLAALLVVYLAISIRSRLEEHGTERIQMAAGDWRLLLEDAPAVGGANARTVVVEFIDYGCSFCRSAEPVLEGLTVDHPERLRRIVRFLPSEQREPPRMAALAALCAHRQGEFERMHKLLYSVIDTLNVALLPKLAELVGIDAGAFHECTAGESAAEYVERDIVLAKRMGISITPTFVINGEITERVSPAVLRVRLSQLLKE